MKIIFSRKGFDSSSGGWPSPLLPDGRMLSLPIPDKRSPIKYQDIACQEYNLGEVVSTLTKDKIRADYNAHLDPDLNVRSVQREADWKPVLGQTDAAQGHLRNNDVTAGDVFLFFGLFKEVTEENGAFAWIKNSPSKHIIWGWLQIGKIIPVKSDLAKLPTWLKYHPHLYGDRGSNNTLYIAEDSGIFTHFSEKLQLTIPDSKSPSMWQLPVWMYPESGKTPLSYHARMDRWNKNGDMTKLNAVSRGQEFILSCADYPEAERWLSELIGQNLKEVVGDLK